MITRANLVEKYKVALKKVKELKNKKYSYKTTRPCEGYGTTSKLSLGDCVKVYATVHEGAANLDSAMTALGITAAELNINERKYLGFTIAEWDSDLKTRVEEIRDTDTLHKYEEVIKKLKNNFSSDDLFAIEMDEVANMGIDLDINTEVKG